MHEAMLRRVQQTAREEYLKGLDPKADALSIRNILLAEHILRAGGMQGISTAEVTELQLQSDREFHNGGDDPVLDALWIGNVLFAEAVLMQGKGTA